MTSLLTRFFLDFGNEIREKCRDFFAESLFCFCGCSSAAAWVRSVQMWTEKVCLTDRCSSGTTLVSSKYKTNLWWCNVSLPLIAASGLQAELTSSSRDTRGSCVGSRWFVLSEEDYNASHRSMSMNKWGEISSVQPRLILCTSVYQLYWNQHFTRRRCRGITAVWVLIIWMKWQFSCFSHLLVSWCWELLVAIMLWNAIIVLAAASSVWSGSTVPAASSRFA